MKVEINTLLTTLTGGCPVVTTKNEKVLNDLYEKSALLNINLPVVEKKNASREELRRENMAAKSAEIYRRLPKLKEMMKTVNVASESLYELIEAGKAGTQEYFDICAILETRAKSILGKDFVSLNFEDEIQA